MKIRSLMLLVLATLSPAVLGANLNISPTRLTFTEQKPATLLTVTNQGTESVSVQADVKRWLQVDNADLLQDDNDLIITPAIFKLAPGSRQIVRIGWRQTPSRASSERSWRVLLSELPAPVDPAAATDTRLRLAMRLSLPLFMPASPLADSRLRWRWQPGETADTARLVIENQGERHARIQQVTLSSPSADTQRIDTQLYVLPGATRVLTVPAGLAVNGQVAMTSDAVTPPHAMHAEQ